MRAHAITSFRSLAAVALLLLCLGPAARQSRAQTAPGIVSVVYPDSVPLAVVTGDFDHNGTTDVGWLLCNGSVPNNGCAPSPIVVWLEHGDGTFSTTTLQVSADPVSNSKGYFAAADLTGNGNLDLIVYALDGSTGLAHLSVFLGNGDGTFGSETVSPLGSEKCQSFHPVMPCFATGDFDGDGKADVLLTDGSLAHGNGDGTFGLPGPSQFSNSISVSAADLNHDSKLDAIITVDTQVLASSGIFVAMGNGDGTFQPPALVVSFDTTIFGALVAVADLNGDGTPDLVVTATENSGSGPDSIVLLGNGDGTFTQKTTLPYALGPAIIDFDGDGKPDALLLVAGNRPQFEVFPGNGDGTFQSFTTAFTSYGQTPFRAAQLDGSGTPTVLAVSGVNPSGSALNNPFSAGYLAGPSSNGTGLLINPSLLDFGNQAVNTISGQRDVVISSAGTSPVTLSGITNPASEFSEVDTCTGTFAPLAACTAALNFVPQAPGPASAFLGIGSDAGRVFPIALFGNGVGPAISVSPMQLTFGLQQVGTVSPAQTVQITNQSAQALVVQFSIGGDFNELDNCSVPLPGGGSGLPAGGSCTVQVRFQPLSTGALGESLIISDSASDRLIVTLSGTGFLVGPQLSVSPTSIDFGQQFTGTSSAPHTVTLSNTGDAPVELSSFTIAVQVGSPNDFTILNTCGATLNPGISCGIGVFFDPAQTTASQGTLTITDNAPGSPQVVQLSGQGTSFTLNIAPGSSPSQTVQAGQTANYSLAIAPTGGFQGTITFTCSGVPGTFQCSVTPATVTLNGTTPVTVQISIVTSGTIAQQPQHRPGWLPLAFPAAAMFGLSLGTRRRRRWGLPLLAAVFLWIGCGSSEPAPTAGSAVGTYVVTIRGNTGNAGQVQTQLTLNVLSQ